VVRIPQISPTYARNNIAKDSGGTPAPSDTNVSPSYFNFFVLLSVAVHFLQNAMLLIHVISRNKNGNCEGNICI